LLRRRRWRRCEPGPLLEFGRGSAAFTNDLIEPAVQPRKGVRDAVGPFVRSCRCGGAWAGVGLRDPFELAGHSVEAIVDGEEVLASSDIFVIGFTIRFAFLPHAFVRLAGDPTLETRGTDACYKGATGPVRWPALTLCLLR
jgi:hypothetical protein